MRILKVMAVEDKAGLGHILESVIIRHNHAYHKGHSQIMCVDQNLVSHVQVYDYVK